MSASKKFDLSSFESNEDTSSTQVKHNKYAQYLEKELAKTSKAVSEVKRISMAFTDNNYEFILMKSTC